MGDQGVIRALTPLGNTARYKPEAAPNPPVNQSQKKNRLQNLNKNLNNSNKNINSPTTKTTGSQGIYVNSNISKSDSKTQTAVQRQGTFTSPSTVNLGQVSKVGTFVKDEDDQSGLEVPRITSASMSQKQVLRTGNNNQVQEANVFIVEDSTKKTKPVSPENSSDSNIAQSKESSKKEQPTPRSKTQFNRAKTKIGTSQVHEKSKPNEKDSAMSNSAEDISESNKEAENQKFEKSLDLKTPFRVPSKSPRKEEAGGSATPIPAEPVLHKKSGYTSEHKKKEDMAYSGSDIVKKAANAPAEDDRVEKLTEMLNQMDQKLAEANEENKRLKKQNQELQDEIRQYKDSQRKTNGEIELLKNEWDQLTKQLESTKVESERLKEQLGQSSEEESTRVKELTDQRTSLEAEVIQMRTDMTKMLAERQKEMQSHESIVAGMKEDTLKQQTTFDEEKRNYEMEILELKKQIEQLKRECNDLRQSKDFTEAENKKLKIDIQNLEKEIENLKAEIKSLEEQLKQSIDNCKALEDERKLLLENKSESDRTEQELEDALKTNAELKKKADEQEKQLQKMTDDFKSVQELNQTITSLQQENGRFAKQINNVTEENLYLRNQSNAKDNELETLRKKSSELSERSETGKVALSSMTELIKEKQAHIEDLQKEVKTISETNSNYLIAMESFSMSKLQNEDVTKAKYDDMEGAHKKLLDENKRLRTVLAHKNMAETSNDSDKAEFQKVLDQKERELDLAQERIVHLETLLDDVYKAREIHMMQNDYINEEDAKMSVTSLPDIRNGHSRNSYTQKYSMKDLSKSHDKKWANHVDNGLANTLRQYRHAESYAKRYEKRPNKLRQAGPLTKLK